MFFKNLRERQLGILHSRKLILTLIWFPLLFSKNLWNSEILLAERLTFIIWWKPVLSSNNKCAFIRIECNFGAFVWETEMVTKKFLRNASATFIMTFFIDLKLVRIYNIRNISGDINQIDLIIFKCWFMGGALTYE